MRHVYMEVGYTWWQYKERHRCFLRRGHTGSWYLNPEQVLVLRVVKILEDIGHSQEAILRAWEKLSEDFFSMLFGHWLAGEMFTITARQSGRKTRKPIASELTAAEVIWLLRESIEEGFPENFQTARYETIVTFGFSEFQYKQRREFLTSTHHQQISLNDWILLKLFRKLDARGYHWETIKPLIRKLPAQFVCNILTHRELRFGPGNAIRPKDQRTSYKAPVPSTSPVRRQAVAV